MSFTLAPHLGPNQRNAELIAHGAFVPRLERMIAIRQFLAAEGLTEAARSHLQGDASTRAYERIAHDGRKLVLMNAPRRPDGPPVRGGLPYSAIAHLAEDVKPFVAMARALRDRGLSAPQVHAANLSEGLLLLEDLGAEGVVAGDPPAPVEERYAAAVDVLVEIHRQQVAFTLPVTPGVEHRLPPYDVEAFLIEAELLLDWYLPYRGIALTNAARSEFNALWRDALAYAETMPPTWVLRDYHSPNLLWLPEREGIKRVGLLDFQDALTGPAPYDLVSLLQDARVDVPDAMEIALLGRYVKGRLNTDPDFATTAFVQLYVTLGAQRATKILGIFARLDRRDGKPQYLRHMPRIWRYLRRALIHPAMNDLKAWYDAHVSPPQ
jgi:aminoglycoside/choline kinase family phosphotransferase